MMTEQMRALNAMMEQSQWRSEKEIREKQLSHFDALLSHACQTVPFYRENYQSLFHQHGNNIHAYPVLTRDIIQATKDNLVSEKIPDTHGGQYPQYTSGSTGKAVRIIATDFTRLFYDAIMLREHNWHQRDLMKKLFSIRWEKRGIGEFPGILQNSWGPPVSQYKNTDASVFMNVACSTENQIDAILYHKPEYILSYPSQFAALAEYCLDHHILFPFVEEIRSTGESFSDGYKHVINQAWPHVKITDVYSSVELGIIAQQCSEKGNYHVNAEGVLVEIVDQGRVLVTSLMNYATPLIRYEIGDYAEWGNPCECGRGLPVIRKIFGRKRNRLVFPNGESRFPYLGEREDMHRVTTAIRKFQIVQHTKSEIEIKVVVRESISSAVVREVIELMQKNLGYPFNINVTFHDDLPVGPTGKFEEFVSCVG